MKKETGDLHRLAIGKKNYALKPTEPRGLLRLATEHLASAGIEGLDVEMH